MCAESWGHRADESGDAALPRAGLIEQVSHTRHEDSEGSGPGEARGLGRQAPRRPREEGRATRVIWNMRDDGHFWCGWIGTQSTFFWQLNLCFPERAVSSIVLCGRGAGSSPALSWLWDPSPARCTMGFPCQTRI